jgi:hypothetical protein
MFQTPPFCPFVACPTLGIWVGYRGLDHREAVLGQRKAVGDSSLGCLRHLRLKAHLSFALVAEFERTVGCRVNSMKMYETPL